MLFLLNDTVLDLDLADFAAPLDAGRLRALSLPDVMRLGAEMFAQSPLMHRQEPDRAGRLAMLIAAKHPDVNAALFVAPERGCRPDLVATNIAQVSFEVMAALCARARDGSLTPAEADKQVWRRMAA